MLIFILKELNVKIKNLDYYSYNSGYIIGRIDDTCLIMQCRDEKDAKRMLKALKHLATFINNEEDPFD